MLISGDLRHRGMRFEDCEQALIPKSGVPNSLCTKEISCSVDCLLERETSLKVRFRPNLVGWTWCGDGIGPTHHPYSSSTSSCFGSGIHEFGLLRFSLGPNGTKQVSLDLTFLDVLIDPRVSYCTTDLLRVVFEPSEYSAECGVLPCLVSLIGCTPDNLEIASTFCPRSVTFWETISRLLTLGNSLGFCC